MEYNERVCIIDKILAGGFFWEVSGSVYYIDLILNKEDKVYLNFIYDKVYKQAVKDGAYTNAEYLDLCTKNGSWNPENEDNLENYRKEIDVYKKSYYANFYNEVQKKIIKNRINENNNKIKELILEKNMLLGGITAEYFAEKQKNRCKYKKIVKDVNGCSLSNYDFLDDSFINKLEVAINENSFTEEKIREIARTNPWRISWEMCKNDFSSLFGTNFGCSTDEQMFLCYWSQFYDGIFASYEKPSDEIIEDDIAIDVWCELKIKEQGSEKAQSSIIGENTKKHKEVFIKTDKDNASSIYEMNNQHVRNGMRIRDKIIKENENISEAELIKKMGRTHSGLFVENRNG